jgi:ribonuclease HI
MIFADGASSGNPGPGGWATIIVTPEGKVEELGGGVPETTNNRMELAGVIRGLDRIRALPGPVDVFTDSTYVIRGITQWIWGWRKNGWKNKEGGEVSNQDLWKDLSSLVAQRGNENPIQWKYVRGHAGIPGNERVDEIAVACSKGRRPRLYLGSLLQYDVAVHDLPESFDLPEMRQQKPKKAAFSYLSLLGGTAVRHSSWAECERRVKGQSGAKFKKAMSPEEETEILRSWGINPASVKS